MKKALKNFANSQALKSETVLDRLRWLRRTFPGEDVVVGHLRVQHEVALVLTEIVSGVRSLVIRRRTAELSLSAIFAGSLATRSHRATKRVAVQVRIEVPRIVAI